MQLPLVNPLDMSGLNPQQHEAATHGRGPCQVLATAGAGKTKVFIMRTAYLIQNGVRPDRILLGTFTKKATDEMRKRLETLIGKEKAKRVYVGTFHSHCLRMLRETYSEHGWIPFDVLPPYNANKLAREVLGPQTEKTPYGMGWSTHPKWLLSLISRAKADLFDVNHAERYVREHTDYNDSIGDICEFWRRYELLKKERNLIDFDDYLLRIYQLFRQSPVILERWQDAYDYILADEDQDTNIAQNKIVTMLADKHKNVFRVGDPNQAIFGFRGSNPSLTTLCFLDTYPDGKIIKLSRNYRSQESIVRRASMLLKHTGVAAEYSVDPSSNRVAGKEPEIFVSEDEEHEASIIASRIIEHLLDGREYKDIAILYRINAQSRALEDAFISRTIPYIVNGSRGFYDRREVLDILAYCQLASDPCCAAGDEAIERIINIPSIWFSTRDRNQSTRFLGKKFVEQLKQLAVSLGCSMFEALDRGEWTRWQWQAIKDFQEVIEAVKRSGPHPTVMIAKAREISYDAYLIAEDSGQSQDDDSEDEATRFDNLLELGSAASRFENVAAFLNFVTQQRSKAKKLAEGQNAVQLLTIHRSKGLEWPIVYVCGLSKGMLPHHRSIQYFDPEHKTKMIPESIQEERRLCYVAVTRGMDEVYMSALLQYNDRDQDVSPFLLEMGYTAPVEYAERDKRLRQENSLINDSTGLF